MRRQHRRLVASSIAGLVLATSVALPASADAPTWGPIWAVGNVNVSLQSLGSTTRAGTSYLHSVSWTQFDFANHTPLGAWYRRSTTDGASWAKVKRLNPASHIVDSVSLATAGRYVYTTWARPAGRGTARMLYVRRNTDHGDLGAWSDRIRLTSTTARIDAPSIAAAGAHVFVAYTNARTGTIRLQTSHDHGRTWSARSLGVTLAQGGRTGYPMVVATGSNVGVFWVSGPAGEIRGRISTDSGHHWGETAALGVGTAPAANARAGRIVVASSDGVTPGWFRIWTAGTWGALVAIPSRLGDPVEPEGYGAPPVVRLSSSAAIGVAYVTRDPGFEGGDFFWRESPDGGLTWEPDEFVSLSHGGILIGAPSVVWRTGVLHIQWSEDQEGDQGARLRTRRGDSS